MRDLVPQEAQAPIRIGLTAREQNESRWGLILVVFMRLLAVLWIIQGIIVWASFMMPREAVFDHMGKSHIAAVMFFSVVDLLAAVGLWLATPWGGVLWLLAAVAQVLIGIFIKRGGSSAWSVCDIALIAIYFVLTYRAARAAQRL